MSKLAGLVYNYVQSVEATQLLEHQDEVRQLELAHLLAVDEIRRDLDNVIGERDRLRHLNELSLRTKEQTDGALLLIRQEAAAEKQRADGLEIQRSNLAKDLDHWKAEYKTLGTKLIHLGDELEQARKVQDIASSKINNEREVLERKVRELNAKLVTEKTTVSRLEREKIGLRDAEKKLKAELADLRAKLQRQTEQTERAVREQDKLTQQFNSQKSVLESKLETLRNKLKTASPARSVSSLMSSPVRLAVPSSAVRSAVPSPTLRTSVVAPSASVMRTSVRPISLGMSPTRPRIPIQASPLRPQTSSLLSPSPKRAPIRPIVTTVKKSTFSTTPFLEKTGRKLFGDPSKAPSQASPTPGAQNLENSVLDGKDKLSEEVGDNLETEVFKAQLPASEPADSQVPTTEEPASQAPASPLQIDTHSGTASLNAETLESGQSLNQSMEYNPDIVEGPTPAPDQPVFNSLEPYLNAVPNPVPNGVADTALNQRRRSTRLSIRSELSFTAITQNNKKISLFDDDEVPRTREKQKKGKRKLKATVDSTSLFDDDGPDQPGSMFKRVKPAPSTLSGLGFDKSISPRKKRNEGLKNIFKV